MIASKMYPCVFCSIVLTNAAAFMIHVKALHKGQLNKEVECPFQVRLQKFDNIYALKRHLAKHNGEQTLPFQNLHR